ncbi:MAG: inositol monophosphatase [Desulfobacteraceae bacterium]|nr:inositol monophosphatase [Desulfobacteraceae bacterium]MBU4054267.1 inositol monophosphatase [Pseudomonadota bacterium]
MDFDTLLKTAIEAALEGGEVTRSLIGRLKHIQKKGAIDLLTEADLESEKRIIQKIREHFPDHSFLAEESSPLINDSPYQWIIDPVDGTTNFAHALNHYAISIALSVEGKIMLGVVFNPGTNELFRAVSGQGAFLNDLPIEVSAATSVSESLLATGFPYNFKEILDPVMTRFKNCLTACQGIRRFGSAALDLCYVACGRFDGYFEQNLKPWDTAAGFLIAQESGATVTDFSNSPFFVEKKEILATNGKIHSQMVSLLTI